MWKDLVVWEFWFHLEHHHGISKGDTSRLTPDSMAVVQIMFDTLQKILQLPDKKTQRAALHGLGHFHHGAVKPLVQSYMQRYSNQWTEEHLQWVRECADGTVR